MKKLLLLLALSALPECLCHPNVVPIVPKCSGCNGAPCGDAGTCNSGHCVDGVCCDSACDQACDVCNLSSAPGTCSPAPASDPGAPACAPYLCGGSSVACPGACDAGADCTATHYCLAAACVPKELPGTSCTGDEVCASGHCVDGLCCDTACDLTCDRCDLMGALGACTPVPKGTPGCGRFNCSGAAACPSGCIDDGDCASGNFCTGTGGTCLGLLDAGAPCTRTGQCGTAFCADGVCCGSACDLSCDHCDGRGVCGPSDAGAAGAPSCMPYVCDGTSATCPPGCGANRDCAPGYACSSTVCLPDVDRDGWADVDDCAPSDAMKATLRSCYADVDTDGFIAAAPTPTCSGASCPAGTQSTPGTDCDDSVMGAYQVLMCSFGADTDNDGFHAGPQTPTCTGASCPDGGSSLRDCDDENVSAFPGQGAYFLVPRDGGSFDYDCNGAENKDPAWDCVTGYAGLAMCQGTKYTGQRGFVGASPGCGDAGVWRTCASWEDATCSSTTWWYGACGLGCITIDGGSSYSVAETARSLGCR